MWKEGDRESDGRSWQPMGREVLEKEKENN
jgi:hypothetical protein